MVGRLNRCTDAPRVVRNAPGAGRPRGCPACEPALRGCTAFAEGHASCLSGLCTPMAACLARAVRHYKPGSRSPSQTAAELAQDPADQELLKFYAVKYDMAYPIVLPPGVPDGVVDAPQHAFDLTMKDPAFREDAKKVGLELTPLDGKAVEALMRQIEQPSQSIIDRLIEMTVPGK